MKYEIFKTSIRGDQVIGLDRVAVLDAPTPQAALKIAKRKGHTSPIVGPKAAEEKIWPPYHKPRGALQ